MRYTVKKCYLTKFWAVSCVLHVSFAATLCNNIGEFKVNKEWWKERIVCPVVIRYSSASFTSRIFYHMTLKHNFTGFHPRYRQSSPPFPTAASNCPCLAARRLVVRAVYKRLPTSLARVSQLSSTDYRWRDATRLSVSLFACFSSQRNITRFSFIFAESHTDVTLSQIFA